MRIISLILVAVIIYLTREITILKSNITSITNQTLLSPNNYVVSNPPQLWLWSSEVSPNGKYRAASYTGDYADRYHYYQIFVTSLTNNRKLRMYTGDFRTSGWEWTNDNKIKIIYDCGTGCQATRIIGPGETAYVNDSESGFITEENGWEYLFAKSL